jgi:hypothetical protein
MKRMGTVALMMLQGAPLPPGVHDAPSVGLIVAAMLGSLPILGILVWGAVKVFGPIAHAIARRIGGETGADRAPAADIAELQRQVADLRLELSEAQERLDFTERLLTRGRTERQQEIG